LNGLQDLLPFVFPKNVGMKQKPVKKQISNLSQIAEAAGVSKMTVSRVLRNAEGFSEATRLKVMREVEKAGYLPNRLAAAFGPGSASTLVGVCVPRLSSHFFGQVLESVDRTFQKLGFQTMIGSHNQQLADEEQWLKSILAWRPAGVLLSSKQHSSGALKLLRDADIPVVEFWNLTTSPLDMSVGFNEFDSGFDMGRHAIEKGYQRAALLGAANDWDAGRIERFNGFSESFAGSGGTIVHEEKLNDTPGFYSGFYGTENILNQDQNIDMIYYQDDTMALGGLSWCQRKGIRVPEDIGIAGWGGHEAASILAERLTTTSVPMRQIGRVSSEMLARKVRQETTNDVIAVPTKLIEGNTL
jgi:LacI family gluconate utilization system Gnt-I transcriptional repressor